MIKAIVLDDGHHERTVVINYGINYAKKSLSSFVNELYNKFEKHSPRTASYFTLLWSSEDLVDGIDIY